MITNERQYRISNAALRKFETALRQLQDEPAQEVHPLLHKARIDSIQSELETLKDQIKQYDDLRAGRAKVSYQNLQSLNDLPRTLIEIRIASGLTQKELATKIGVKEQQIQRYEASGYAGASLSRVVQVAAILASGKKNRRPLNAGTKRLEKKSGGRKTAAA